MHVTHVLQEESFEIRVISKKSKYILTVTITRHIHLGECLKLFPSIKHKQTIIVFLPVTMLGSFHRGECPKHFYL